MGEEEKPAIGDGKIRDRILDGLEAFAELQRRFRRKLELHLIAHCGKHDGRSHEQAVEIASQVLADCFTGSPSLLARWRGEENLEAFLRTVALNRLKSWWSSRDAAVTVDSESTAITRAQAEPGSSKVDRKELIHLQEALAGGVADALTQCPEGVLFMRLKGLHGIGQREISSIWSHHESQTSRRIREAMDVIHSTAVQLAESSGSRADFEAVRQALQADPSILLGSGGAPLDRRDEVLLQNLAGGNLEPADRDLAVELMCRNAEALAAFARLLRQRGESESASIRDSALEGVGARIQSAIRTYLDVLTPVELRRRIDPLLLGVFGDMLRAISADGGTLWWLDPKASVLEAVFNPFEPEIEGMRQPLASGIISLSLATSETVVTKFAESHDAHSPVVDVSLGKTTHSMIAVPVAIHGRNHGVVTAVRFDGSESFSADDVATVERQGRLSAALLIHSLTNELAGGSD